MSEFQPAQGHIIDITKTILVFYERYFIKIYQTFIAVLLFHLTTLECFHKHVLLSILI